MLNIENSIIPLRGTLMMVTVFTENSFTATVTSLLLSQKNVGKWHLEMHNGNQAWKSHGSVADSGVSFRFPNSCDFGAEPILTPFSGNSKSPTPDQRWVVALGRHHLSFLTSNTCQFKPDLNSSLDRASHLQRRFFTVFSQRKAYKIIWLYRSLILPSHHTKQLALFFYLFVCHCLWLTVFFGPCSLVFYL